MHLRLLAALVALLVVAGCSSVTISADGVETPERTYERSLALFQGKSYAAARDGFVAYRAAVGEGEPRAPHLVDALFYEGESRYLDGDKFAAHELYRRILEKYRNFPKIADVINREYEIGSAFVEGKATKSFLGIGYKSEATGVEILEYLIERYQQKYFDYAQYQVADYYFRDHDWRRAADAYLALEENFKTSPWAGVAQYQRALCYLGLSRGYRYDPAPVLKAEEVLLGYVKKNPAGSRIREAERALERIREGRCKLYVEDAEFYLWREKKPRAALVYCDAILRETPDAPDAKAVPGLLRRVIERAEEGDPPAAQQAREMLADLEKRKAAPPAGAPAVPPADTTKLLPGVRPASAATRPR